MSLFRAQFEKKTTGSMLRHFILNHSSYFKRANVVFETFSSNPQAKIPLSICKGFQRVGLLVNFDDSYIMMICGTWALKINILVATLIMHKPLLVFEVCKYTRYAIQYEVLLFFLRQKRAVRKKKKWGRKRVSAELPLLSTVIYIPPWLYSKNTVI